MNKNHFWQIRIEKCKPEFRKLRLFRADMEVLHNNFADLIMYLILRKANKVNYNWVSAGYRWAIILVRQCHLMALENMMPSISLKWYSLSLVVLTVAFLLTKEESYIWWNL